MLLPFLLLLVCHKVPGLQLEEGSDCVEPLGMEDGRIRDSQLTASSSYQPSLVGPSKARLHSELGGGAWCPRSQVSDQTQAQEWLEVDLEEDHVITGLVTQGRFAHGLGQEYAELYMLQFWREGQERWENYKNLEGGRLLPGNSNTFSPTEIPLLAGPVIASRIRVLPFSHHTRTVCLRLEIRGCKYNGNFFSLLTGASLHNDSASLHKARQVDDWNEATFLGAAVGILVTVTLAALAAIVLVLVRNRAQRKSLASFSRYSTGVTDSSRSSIPRSSIPRSSIPRSSRQDQPTTEDSLPSKSSLTSSVIPTSRFSQDAITVSRQEQASPPPPSLIITPSLYSSPSPPYSLTRKPLSLQPRAHSQPRQSPAY